MIINTEGIILRQVKATGGRRMLLLFTPKYGKISVGSSLNEKGRTKAALALRPFTYGNYELYQSRDAYHLNQGEVKKSFYGLGEDVDKYMQASLVLELTDKMLPEDLPQPGLFRLLVEYLTALERRDKRHETLLLAYEIKALALLGTSPEMDRCACCGAETDLIAFSVRDGGMICGKCREKRNDSLIYDVKFDIVNIVRYFSQRPFSAFEKIALDANAAETLQQILRAYMSYHLDIGRLKSEYIFEENF